MSEMLFILFLILFCFFIIFFSSMHVMMVLLFIEFMVLVAASYLSFNNLWFSFIMVIMVGVCLGAYGISIMISNSQSKGYSYLYLL